MNNFHGFRVYDPVKKEMHYDDYLLAQDGTLMRRDFEMVDTHDTRRCVATLDCAFNETMMLNTGYKDAGFDPIYEHDILNIEGKLCVIRKPIEMWQCCWVDERHITIVHLIDVLDKEIEIVGNIHENKEMPPLTGRDKEVVETTDDGIKLVSLEIYLENQKGNTAKDVNK